MTLNDDEFYARISKYQFDKGIQMISGKTLSNVVKLLVMTDSGVKSPGESRIMMMLAAQKLVKQLIDDLRVSFKDVDDFLVTGEFPKYMSNAPDVLKDMLRKVGKSMGDEDRR